MSSIAGTLHKLALGGVGPMANSHLFKSADPMYQLFKPKTPPPSPGVPNPNDAANAAQSMTDQMRMRRGLMANIYAGASSTAPVVGKTQLGT